MSIRTAWVAVVLLGVPACGEEVAAPPRATPLRPTIEVAEARAIAKAAQLRLADLPGYRVPPKSADDIPDDPLGAGSSCLKAADFLADRSAEFARGDVEIASTAQVAGTAEQVKEDVAYFQSPEFPPCLERAFVYQFAIAHLTATSFSSRRFAVRVPGADQAFGFSMRLAVRYEGVRLQMHLVTVAAAVGHAELDVTGVAVAKRVPNAPAVSRLTALLAKCVRRARAAAKSS